MQVFEQTSAHKAQLGRYATHLLADYLGEATRRDTPGGMEEDAPPGQGAEGAAALTPGVYMLMDACSPCELQQMFALLARGRA